VTGVTGFPESLAVVLRSCLVNNPAERGKFTEVQHNLNMGKEDICAIEELALFELLE
jgi:hypothetical protein